MKTKCFFLIVTTLVLLFGCNKDAFFGEEPELTLKKANVPIPFKGELCMTPDNEIRIPVHWGSPDGPIVPNLTLAKIAWLFGNATHLGKLDEQSFMTCQEGAYTDGSFLYATYDIKLFAANGDYIEGISIITINSEAKTLTADYHFTGGSGRFENVTGSGLLSGELHCWDVEGTLEYPRD
jgi:hypothetical protein